MHGRDPHGCHAHGHDRQRGRGPHVSACARVGRRRPLLTLTRRLAVSEHDDRLMGLEERLMHQERLLETLDEVVTAQQGVIETLTRELARLTEQIADGPSEDVDEPPPHY